MNQEETDFNFERHRLFVYERPGSHREQHVRTTVFSLLLGGGMQTEKTIDFYEKDSFNPPSPSLYQLLAKVHVRHTYGINVTAGG